MNCDADGVPQQLRVGGYLNLVYGTPKWLFIYLASGIFGAMMRWEAYLVYYLLLVSNSSLVLDIMRSCVFLPSSVGVGSSGALMGMLSSWVVWIIFRWKKIPPECKKQRNCQLLIVTAAIVVTLATSAMPNVDWAAHVGGAIQVRGSGHLLVYRVCWQCALYWLLYDRVYCGGLSC